MRRIVCLAFIALVFVAAAVPVRALPAPGTLGPAGSGEPDVQGQLASVLAELVRLSADGRWDEAEALARGQGARLEGNSVQVVVEAQAGRVGQVLAWLDDQSLELQASHQGRMQVMIPVNRLADVAALPGITQVRLPHRPLPLLTGQGVTVTQAVNWQAAGLTGSGVKVAVFDLGFAGYADLVTSGELPADVQVRSFRADGDIAAGEVHGTACAEIIHDMAPGAQLYLLNLETDVEFANAVDWAISQGVQVGSCSLAWLGAGTLEGDGPICADVNGARNAGIFWAQAAGNAANKHWEGDWSDPDGDGQLNFSGSDELLSFYASAGTTIYVNLLWDEPWGAAANNYDLYLYNSIVDDPVASSTDVQNGNDYPSEFIGYTVPTGGGGTYHVSVRNISAPATPRVEIYSFRQSFEYTVAGSSLMTPADAEGAVATGATYWQTDGVEAFSSRGPTNDGRLKPEFAAPDGVSSAAYGGSFFGTSAAAPHLAGAAALVRSVYPAFTVTDTASYLTGRAVDLQTVGPDYLTGYGRLSMAGVPASPTASPTPSLTPAAVPTMVTLGSAEDTRFYKWDETRNYCLEDLISVGYKQWHSGLVRFDLSSIPADATIISATMQLWGVGWNAENLTIGVHYITRTVSMCQATWLSAYAGSNWGAPGCESVTTDRRETAESSVTTLGVGRWYLWPLTDVVQGWVSGGLANNGVLLRGASNVLTGTMSFASADHANVGWRPKLVVYYRSGGSVPEATPTSTSTSTATVAPSATATATRTVTPTPTSAVTRTATRTSTATATPAATSTATQTSMPTETPTVTATSALPSPTVGPVLVTLGGAEDTYMYQYAPTANYCGSDQLKVGYKQQNAGLVRFNTGMIPAGATVVSATLQLYATSWGGAGLDIGAYYITRTVSACQATWSVASAGNPWGIAGGNDIATDRRPAPESQLTAASPGAWYAWPLTQVVQGWVNGSLANNGVLVRGASGVLTGTMSFASAEHANASWRPKLVVYYLGGDGALTPTPTSTSTTTPTAVPTHTPTATATATRTCTPTPTAAMSQTATRTPTATMTVAATSTVTPMPSATATASGAPVMLTLNGAEDTFVYQYALTGYCADSKVRVGYKQQNAGLVRFDVGAIPIGATVVSATLQMYATSWSGSPLTVGAYFITRTVVACQSTWTVASTGNSWGQAGCNDISTDRRPSPEHQVITSGPALYVWPITTLVQGWVNGQWPNNGVLLRGVDALDQDSVDFASAEHGTVGLGPRLVVYYTGDTGVATATLTPTPTYSSTPVATPTPTLTPAQSLTPTVTPTHTGTATPTATRTPTATVTPTLVPTSTATLTVIPSVTPTRTASPTLAAGVELTMTLQQGLDGYSGATDSYIYQWQPTLNYSTINTLLVGQKQQYAALLRFDLSSVPADAHFTSAILELYSVGWSGSGTGIMVGAHAITRTTDLDTVTWDLARTGAPWAIPGCNDVATDRRPAPESTVATTYVGRWHSLSVTQLVQGWSNGSVANNGFLLRSAYDPTNPQFFLFASAEYSDRSLRPRLRLSYHIDPVEPGQTPTRTVAPTITRTATATATPTLASGVEYTVTIQQGTNGSCEDSYLFQYAASGVNYCMSDTLIAGVKQQYVSLLRFDLSAIPAAATVTRARLQVYANGWSGQDSVLGTYVISRTVDMCEATWEKSQASQWWGSPGCTSTQTDRAGLLSGAVKTNGIARWYDLDVTRAARDWVQGSTPNNGLLLVTSYTSFTGTFRFASSQHSEVGLRPRLVVSYVVYDPTPTPRAQPYLVIGHITDDHVGRNDVCTVQLQTIAGLISQQADVLVDTGDCTENGTDQETRDYREHMGANMTIPWQSVPGNHDTPDVFLQHVGTLNWWWDVGGYRLIGIDSEAINRYAYDPQAMNALDAALTTEKPCIVFGHFPLDSEGYSAETNQQLRERFAAYHVLLYVTGHWHTNSFTTDPTSGTMLLVGNWTCGGHYRIIRLDGTSVQVEQYQLGGTGLGACDAATTFPPDSAPMPGTMLVGPAWPSAVDAGFTTIGQLQLRQSGGSAR